MKLPTHISYNLKKSFYLLSWKSLSCMKFMNWKYFRMKFNSFQNPFHLFKWKKSCHLLSRVLYLKRIWIHGDHKSKMKVWESPFIPSHLTFKSFKFPLNFTQATTPQSITQQSNNQSIYLFIIAFQNLEFWDVTNLPPLKWILSSRFGEARKK